MRRRIRAARAGEQLSGPPWRQNSSPRARRRQARAAGPGSCARAMDDLLGFRPPGHDGRAPARAGDEYVPQDQGLARRAIDNLLGFRLLGLRRTERILPVGVTLAAVGEVARAADAGAAAIPGALRAGAGEVLVLRVRPPATGGCRVALRGTWRERAGTPSAWDWSLRARRVLPVSARPPPWAP